MTMPRNTRYPTWGALALLLVLALCVGVWWLQKPKPAPDVAVALLGGGQHRFADYAGKKLTLVKFWATSCPPCVAEMPDLQRAYEELAPQGLQIIAIAVQHDQLRHVQRFGQSRQITFPLAWDAQGHVAKAWGGVPLTPTAYWVAPDGTIIHRQVGATDIAALRQAVARATLAGPG